MAKPQTHTCTFKPLPLNKKENTESKEVKKILEVKMGDSKATDSESKGRAESAKLGDSERLDLESKIPKIQEAKTRASQAVDSESVRDFRLMYGADSISSLVSSGSFVAICFFKICGLWLCGFQIFVIATILESSLIASGLVGVAIHKNRI